MSAVTASTLQTHNILIAQIHLRISHSLHQAYSVCDNVRKTLAVSVLSTKKDALIAEIDSCIKDQQCPSCKAHVSINEIISITLSLWLFNNIRSFEDSQRSVGTSLLKKFGIISSNIRGSNTSSLRELTTVRSLLTGSDLLKVFSTVALTGDPRAQELRRSIFDAKRNIWEIITRVHRHPDLLMSSLALLAVLQPLRHIPTETDIQIFNNSIIAPGNDVLAYGRIPMSSRLAIDYARITIEKFMEDRSLSSIFESVLKFRDYVKDKPDARALFGKVDEFFMTVLSDPKRFNSLEGKREFKEKLSEIIADQLVIMINNGPEYEEKARNMLNELSAAVSNLISSKSFAKLKGDLGKLFCDIFMDSNHNLLFKYVAIKDLTFLCKFWSKRLSTIPLPRIEVHEKSTDFVVDNVTLKSTVIPTIIDISTSARLSLVDSKESSGSITLHLRGISVSAHNVGWMYYGHKGIMRGANFGLANISTKKGEGISIYIEVKPRLRRVAVSSRRTKLESQGGKLTDLNRDEIVRMAMATALEMDDALEDERHSYSGSSNEDGHDNELNDNQQLFHSTLDDDDEDNAMPHVRANRHGLSSVREKSTSRNAQQNLRSSANQSNRDSWRTKVSNGRGYSATKRSTDGRRYSAEGNVYSKNGVRGQNRNSSGVDLAFQSSSTRKKRLSSSGLNSDHRKNGPILGNTSGSVADSGNLANKNSSGGKLGPTSVRSTSTGSQPTEGEHHRQQGAFPENSIPTNGTSILELDELGSPLQSPTNMRPGESNQTGGTQEQELTPQRKRRSRATLESLRSYRFSAALGGGGGGGGGVQRNGKDDKSQQQQQQQSGQQGQQHQQQHVEGVSTGEEALSETSASRKAPQVLYFPKFTVVKVKCDLSALQFDIASNRSSVMQRLLLPLGLRRVRKVLERHVERFAVRMATAGNAIIKTSVMNQVG